MSKDYYDFLIVGAGFAGAVCAQQLSELGKTVLLIDKRSHIAGNAYDSFDEHGVLIHNYGPHIFHTNSKKIFEYLSRFTNWRFYEHRVLAEVDGKKYPIPINRKTINELYGLNLDEEATKIYLETVREKIECIKTSEDVILNSVGKDLCDKFFRGYTKKQWGLDISELSAGVAARIPTRTNDDNRYFTDDFQFMPADGYTKMFEKMISQKNITIKLSTTLESVQNLIDWSHMIYTGPVDSFYNYRFGKLPYRSLSFDHEHIEGDAEFQGVGTVNYPNDHEYTRITEFKHLTGQKCKGTSIVREYPQSTGEPYYPIPRPENEKIFKAYEALTKEEANVSFVGRLAQYRYYNMDQVVGASLALSKKIMDQFHV
jgi:UDP-galactopyranose mutase